MSLSVVYMMVIFPFLIVLLMAMDLVEPQSAANSSRSRDKRTQQED